MPDLPGVTFRKIHSGNPEISAERGWTCHVIPFSSEKNAGIMLTYRVTGFLRKRYDLPESSVSVPVIVLGALNQVEILKLLVPGLSSESLE